MASSGTGETRVVALVGPQSSGKTELLKSMIRACAGVVKNGLDASPESQSRQMGVELNIASFSFMDETFTALDCPGAVELAQESLSALPAADAAIIVVEPDAERIAALAPLMHHLESLEIPRFVALNKVDRATGSIAEMAQALRSISKAPVVLRQIPIRQDGKIIGYGDLAQQKAHLYRAGQESVIVDMPETIRARLSQDRQSMLETLADYDDHLMEELLEEIDPPADEIYRDLATDVQTGKIVPVFMASAEQGFGVRRLLKALRHELPGFSHTKARLGASADTRAIVVKTVQTAHAGKLSVARLLNGTLKDGESIGGGRLSGLYTLHGLQPEKTASAKSGDIVGLGKLDGLATGMVATSTACQQSLKPLSPLYARVLVLKNRTDDVKLSGALAKLCEEDPSLSTHHDAETHQLVLNTQGDVHVALTLERLKRRFGLDLGTAIPQVPYRETIRKGTTQHSRFKRQSGGHGAFGDVTIEVAPLTDGRDFEFIDAITGGVVPRQYIPSVEEGVRVGLANGPLGFPVTGVSIKLTDGKYHTVDSSDMAFQTVGRQAIQEALPSCAPILLEPVMAVRIHVPALFTSKVNAVVMSRRGALLGFDARPDWPGWDTVMATIPQSEMDDLIIDLRSLTQGAASFDATVDHHSEVSGKPADQIIKARRSQLESSPRAA